MVNGHNENEIHPAAEDYQKLWAMNATAYWQLHAIVMERLYKETREKLEAFSGHAGKDT